VNRGSNTGEKREVGGLIPNCQGDAAVGVALISIVNVIVTALVETYWGAPIAAIAAASVQTAERTKETCEVGRIAPDAKNAPFAVSRRSPIWPARWAGHIEYAQASADEPLDLVEGEVGGAHVVPPAVSRGCGAAVSQVSLESIRPRRRSAFQAPSPSPRLAGLIFSESRILQAAPSETSKNRSSAERRAHQRPPTFFLRE
jgi:hypothetical protein